jgi:hypothetical protein
VVLPCSSARILAARKLSNRDGRPSQAFESAIADAFSGAERIRARIDARWPTHPLNHVFSSANKRCALGHRQEQSIAGMTRKCHSQIIAYFLRVREARMRQPENIQIRKLIVHSLDSSEDPPLSTLSDAECVIEPSIKDFFAAQIQKALTDENAKIAKFSNGDGLVKRACAEIFERNNTTPCLRYVP